MRKRRRRRGQRCYERRQHVQNKAQLLWLPGSLGRTTRDVVEGRHQPLMLLGRSAQSGCRHILGHCLHNEHLLLVGGERFPAHATRHSLDEQPCVVSETQAAGGAIGKPAALALSPATGCPRRSSTRARRPGGKVNQVGRCAVVLGGRSYGRKRACTWVTVQTSSLVRSRGHRRLRHCACPRRVRQTGSGRRHAQTRELFILELLPAELVLGK